MKIIFIVSFTLLFCLQSFAQLPKESSLYKEILAMDTAFFEAYNNCDLDAQDAMISEKIEFFHDKGGYTTDKQGLLESLKNNICGKVKRTLVEGSFEVHEIPNYGVVAMGYHTFYNKQEPDAEQKPGRFINLLTKNEKEIWQLTKVISLH
ncbi:nuclear transport factor 2 family protein [Dokdonia sp. Hel_I_53]|uniref:nuclear transport factor 2 family protein n=1 Tax=Dokdonia sp. Hel_I_53 TaxID=1566287 RepID=UPI001199EA20|nr:nuclear transport factor 2 family protein [Dokdonia sp. Hel_I_53]TVZ53245.1 uncharacterized protein DUF4440 [Dokdonia sp. Hel_I_53]